MCFLVFYLIWYKVGQNGPLGLDLEILLTGLGSKVGQNGPFYTTNISNKTKILLRVLAKKRQSTFILDNGSTN